MLQSMSTVGHNKVLSSSFALQLVQTNDGACSHCWSGWRAPRYL